MGVIRMQCFSVLLVLALVCPASALFFHERKMEEEGAGMSSTMKCTFVNGGKPSTGDNASFFYIPSNDRELYEKGIQNLLTQLKEENKAAEADLNVSLACDKVGEEEYREGSCQLCVYNEVSADKTHLRQGQVVGLKLQHCMNGIYSSDDYKMSKSHYYPICFPSNQKDASNPRASLQNFSQNARTQGGVGNHSRLNNSQDDGAINLDSNAEILNAMTQMNEELFYDNLSGVVEQLVSSALTQVGLEEMQAEEAANMSSAENASEEVNQAEGQNLLEGILGSLYEGAEPEGVFLEVVEDGEGNDYLVLSEQNAEENGNSSENRTENAEANDLKNVNQVGYSTEQNSYEQRHYPQNDESDAQTYSADNADAQKTTTADNINRSINQHLSSNIRRFANSQIRPIRNI